MRHPRAWPASPGARSTTSSRATSESFRSPWGSIVAFVGVPSFVVTLAGFLIWQGVILQVLEQRGTIIIQDRWINYTASYFFSDFAGWLIAGIITGIYGLTVLGGAVGKRRAEVA